MSLVRPLSLIGIVWFGCGTLFSQTPVKPPPGPPSKIEPGLELAVNWKWSVAPSDKKEWGMPLPEALMPKTPTDSAVPKPVAPAVVRPETYEVKKGDAIIKIARKFGMTVAQLKQFNDLKDDLIHIGQTLRIPTQAQLLTMTPPPPPPEPKKDESGKKKTDKSSAPAEPVPDTGGEAQRELDNVLLQVFLDREMFSPGVINGKSGTTFQKISQVYQDTHPDAENPGLLKTKAEAAVKQPYTTYVLRAEDFKFIKWPKDEPKVARKKGSKADKAALASGPPPAHVTIDELVAQNFLSYNSTWEFVAERFHCDEAFLHHINQQLKGTPVVGSEFQVPNVIPFEIEKALDLPLQPAADPKKPVTAAVVLVSRLEISCEGKLIAVMPLATARPGLHGRGSWTVLDAIPQPRMATKREPREELKEKPAATGTNIPSDKAPSIVPVVETPAESTLEKEQYLPPGPNNPVGIIWINLAKAGSTDPLSFGLHGTSIPSQMGTLHGIGGLRLTNWDIARAIRLLPSGTPLHWKAK